MNMIDDDLRELGRLNAERADAKPPARAVHGPAEQHRDEGEADDQPTPAQMNPGCR